MSQELEQRLQSLQVKLAPVLAGIALQVHRDEQRLKELHTTPRKGGPRAA